MADPSGLAFSMPPNNQPPQADVNNSRFARLSAIQASMRSYLNPFGSPSSLYSRSPDPNNVSTVNGPATTPKPAFRFFGRWGETTSPSESMLDLSLDPQPVPTSYSPARQPSEWAREYPPPSEPDRLFVLDSRRETQIGPGHVRGGLVEETGANVDLESGTARQPRRHRKHRRRRQDGSWTRGHRSGTSRHGSNPIHSPTQAKRLPALTSGLFLVATLTTCK
jgi:hypothetical protein